MPVAGAAAGAGAQGSLDTLVAAEARRRRERPRQSHTSHSQREGHWAILKSEDTRSSCERDGHRTVAESYVAVEPPMPRARAICGSHLARGLRSP